MKASKWQGKGWQKESEKHRSSFDHSSNFLVILHFFGKVQLSKGWWSLMRGVVVSTLQMVFLQWTIPYPHPSNCCLSASLKSLKPTSVHRFVLVERRAPGVLRKIVYPKSVHVAMQWVQFATDHRSTSYSSPPMFNFFARGGSIRPFGFRRIWGRFPKRQLCFYFTMISVKL